MRLSLSRDDYEVLSYVQEGALGKVYMGRCLSTSRFVALKFFGYTKKRPKTRHIQREIKNLSLLKGVEGIVQMEGIFYDTAQGILDKKIHHREYPVIVTEWLEGGALFDRIHRFQTMTEMSLAMIFQKVIHAIENLHRHNIVHRDIKLENLMFVNHSESSPIKIIDLGLSVELVDFTDEHTNPGTNSGIFIDHSLAGTPGSYAPESILYFHYTKKTDLWQAGCALYSLLSGLLPFNPKYPEEIIQYSYYEMIGPCWDTISSHAKNLVMNLLQKDSYLRYSCRETLNHCWIVDSAPEIVFDSSYFQRIQTLKLKNKLKEFFITHGPRLRRQNYQTRQQLQQLFPFLESGTTSADLQLNSSTSNAAAAAAEYGLSQYRNIKQNYEKFLNFQIKIRTMKELVLRSHFHTGPEEGEEKEHAFAVSASVSASRQVGSKGMTYSDYVSVLLQCHLPELARPEIFSIFDQNNSGTIDIKEFLFTMLAFKQLPLHSSSSPSLFPSSHHQETIELQSHNRLKDAFGAPSSEPGDELMSPSERESEYRSLGSHSVPLHLHEDENEDEEASQGENDLESRLFFSVFDLDDSGSINMQELEFIIRSLLIEDDHASSPPPLQDDHPSSSLCSSTSLSNPTASFSSHSNPSIMSHFSFDSLHTSSSTPHMQSPTTTPRTPIGELFDVMDVSRNGEIDYSEFKVFYNSILSPSNATLLLSLKHEHKSEQGQNNPISPDNGTQI
jgi:serine/threonine protein kinase